MSQELTAFGALRFTAPAGWEDRSLLTFLAPSSSDGAGSSTLASLRPMPKPSSVRPNVVITRDPKVDGEDLSGFAGKQQLIAKQRLSSLRCLEETALEVAGRPALRFVHSFQESEHPSALEQAQLFIDGGRDVVTFTVTYPQSAKETFATAVESLFASIAAAG